MPEGDTIHRIAAALAAELPGRTIDRLVLHDQGEIRELAGCGVHTVRAVGKHMLVDIEGNWTLRVHLGMNGTWRKRHVREKRPVNTTVVIEMGDAVYACTRAYRAELIRTHALRAHPRLGRLGPDLLADPVPIDGIMDRASLPAHATREIAELLLDQRVASGIGNVIKSEALFVSRIHPRTRVQDLSSEKLRALFLEAARLLHGNLKTRRRESVPLRRRGTPGSDRLWVYGRAGKPCLECGTPIQRFPQGDMARSTYVCPHCQSVRVVS